MISSTTFSSQSTVNITSGIDSTYDEYVFVCTDLRPSAQDGFEFQTSTDGGTSWGVTVMSTNFRGYLASNDTTGLAYLPGDDNANNTGHVLLTENDAIGMNVDTSCAAIILHLFQPSSTTCGRPNMEKRSGLLPLEKQTFANRSRMGKSSTRDRCKILSLGQ